MSDAVTIKGATSIFRLIVAAMKGIGAGDKAEVTAIKRLTDRKLAEIQATHKLFLRLLRRLLSAANEAKSQSADKHIAQAILLKELRYVLTEREKRRAERRKQFEEANIYADSIFEERGLLKTIPGDVALDLQTFMERFCGYFLRDRHYQHQLSEAIASANSVVALAHRTSDDSAVDEHLSLLSDDLQIAIESSEESWAEVTKAYYRLYRTFVEHGFIFVGQKRDLK